MLQYENLNENTLEALLAYVDVRAVLMYMADATAGGSFLFTVQEMEEVTRYYNRRYGGMNEYMEEAREERRRLMDEVRFPDDGDPTTLKLLMGAYDWQEAMAYAEFAFDDIEEVLYAREGENDERDWLLIVRLKYGQFGALRARCDYSGWSCQAGGESELFDTLEGATVFLFRCWPCRRENHSKPIAFHDTKEGCMCPSCVGVE